MAYQRTRGICLRAIDYSETSQVLRFFTRDHGKVSCIAKGSKRRKTAFHGAFDLLQLCELIRIEKEPGSLDILTQAEAVRSFDRLRGDYGRFSAACYAAEFADEFTQEAQPIEGLWTALLTTLERLDGDTPVAPAVFSFEARALKALGYFPRVRECGACGRKIARPEAYFAAGDGGAIGVDCRPRDQKRFLVRRATLESIAHFGEGEMPKEGMKPALVDEIRRVFDAMVWFYAGKELRSARFMRGALTGELPVPGPRSGA